MNTARHEDGDHEPSPQERLVTARNRRAALAGRIVGLMLGLALGMVVHAQRTATATATAFNGSVVDITVTDPGERYTSLPSVNFSGGGGSGASATASLSAGRVSAIIVTTGGSGYATAPSVVIGPPGVLTIERIPKLTISGQVGVTNQIQWKDDLVDATGWTMLTNIVLSSSPLEFYDTISPPGRRGFYRVMASRVLELEMVVRITITGHVGFANEVQWLNAYGPTNDWVVLTSIVLPISPFVFYDTFSPKGSQRFYRAVVGGGGARPAVLPGFVWIPRGHFAMGSPNTEQGRFLDEGPQTIVTLSRGFFMGSHEVTQGEYKAVVGVNPSFFTGDPNRPVERVRWHDATNYCGRLTVRELTVRRLPAGWVYRLPTEAEWEYAARAGRTNRFGFGDDLDHSVVGEYAWHVGNSGGASHVVRVKQPNRWGLHDMHGNVWEWCWDWYGSYPGGAVTDPRGATSGPSHVLRGGSWNSDASDCRSARRGFYALDNPLSNVGFRVVLAPSA